MVKIIFVQAVLVDMVVMIWVTIGITSKKVEEEEVRHHE